MNYDFRNPDVSCIYIWLDVYRYVGIESYFVNRSKASELHIDERSSIAFNITQSEEINDEDEILTPPSESILCSHCLSDFLETCVGFNTLLSVAVSWYCLACHNDCCYMWSKHVANLRMYHSVCHTGHEPRHVDERY